MRNRVWKLIPGLAILLLLLTVACTGRHVHDPVIVEKEVIVTVEVIKEVPVEKVVVVEKKVVKEVIKEIPVEVLVIKEVVVEKVVEKEVPVVVSTTPVTFTTVTTIFRDDGWDIYYTFMDSPGGLGELHLLESEDGTSRIVVFFDPTSRTLQHVGRILLSCSSADFTTSLLCHLDAFVEEHRNLELQSILDQLLSK